MPFYLGWSLRVLPPSEKEGAPVLVTFSFVVDDLLDVNEKSFSVTVEYHMAMRWNDTRLTVADNVTNVAGIPVDSLKLEPPLE